MKYRLFGLALGLLSLSVSLALACGGSSDEPASSSGATSVPSGATSAATADENVSPDEPVAVVNDEAITKQQFDDELANVEASYQQQGSPMPQGDELRQLKQQVMQRLVQQTLVIQETEARSITATDEEVEAEYQTTAASFPDAESFDQALEAEGLTETDLRALITDNIKISKLLDSVVTEAAVAPPTEEELQALYDQASLQQQLPPFEEIREQLVAELQNQKETQVIQAFVRDLEARSDIQILVEL